ncbi:hypothetical protein ACDY96_20205 [Rhizobium mongolense]|uniref:hypothetical protein n=1 Tax=Rhizobium mongolense TaxID=57676 RepID=UPI00355727AD
MELCTWQRLMVISAKPYWSLWIALGGRCSATSLAVRVGKHAGAKIGTEPQPNEVATNGIPKKVAA